MATSGSALDRCSHQSEKGKTATNQKHSVGGADEAVAHIAYRVANKEQHRRPHNRRGDVGKPEAVARHAHDAGSERYHSAHRAEEAADEDALATVPGKKPDAAGQQLGVAGERPDPGDSAPEAAADPVRDGVAEHGTGYGSHHDRHIGQRARRHQRAGGDHDRHRPARMRRDEVEGRLNEVLHLVVIAMSQPTRQSPQRLLERRLTSRRRCDIPIKG